MPIATTPIQTSSTTRRLFLAGGSAADVFTALHGAALASASNARTGEQAPVLRERRAVAR